MQMSPTLYSLSTCFHCGRWIGWGYAVLGKNLCGYRKVSRGIYRIGCHEGMIQL